MQGTRKYDTSPHLFKLGDYGKFEGVWYASAPLVLHEFNHLLANLNNHQVTEHEDGTISVNPSILVKNHLGEWHGYLTKGVWIPC